MTSKTAPDDLGPCPLCGRPMVDGPSIDRHHWVPRSRGGRQQSAMHQVCHRKIHAVLSEAELAHDYADAEALRAHPEIARFIAWVQRKPPEWNAWHRSAGRR
ncbi:MAG: HNH endonuclease [Proteobacteria bacterium]|nr:HNH endonuclease [Pseudomonadota bacterium]MDA1069933.1 HNH endonuclease [Pseudomonadota bacterium]